MDKLNNPLKEFDDRSKTAEGISVIISTYNNVDYMEECLDSVCNQTYFENNENYEILLGIDGCEKTLKKVKEIKGKYKNLIVYFMPENKGMYVTSNFLIQQSRYDKLITFGSDDTMKINMIKNIVDISKRADVVRFKFDVFGDKGGEIAGMAGNYFAYGAAFFKRKVFELYGGYDNTRFSGDLELLTRLKKFVRVGLLDRKVFNYRYHQTNLSNTVNRSERNEYDAKLKTKCYTQGNVKIIPILNIGQILV